MSEAKPVQVPYGAYHKTTFPAHDPELTEVQPGSPMGEYMRKFWHPVCLSEELTDVPKAICILGEDLVAFRDRSGQVGVLQRHCSHRGTSLEYGIIQPKGIRCCYHGWVYDIDGTILEMPAEPKDSKIYDTVVHGAYPAFERSGLIFAYMGDPAQKPDFPEYDSFTRPAGTKLVAFSFKGLSLCFRSHQMLIGLLRSRHGFRAVPGDARELLDLRKLVSSAVRQAGGPVFGSD